MQWILGLDFSSYPSEVTVSRVEGTLVEVHQRRVIDLELFTDPSILASPETAKSISRVSASGTDEGSNGVTAPVEVNGDEATPPGSEDTSRSEDEYLIQRITSSVAKLKDCLRGLEPVWTACVVTMPAYNGIALNLNLPFGDSKNLNRIVDLEVQDVVPFELDEFLVQYASLGPAGAKAPSPAAASPSSASTSSSAATKSQFDVHIGVLPRNYVRSILALCKSVGLEPFILTVPSSTIGAIFHIAKEYFKGNSAILFMRDTEYSLVVNVNDQVRVEHTIRSSHIAATATVESGEALAEEHQRSVFTALKLMIAAVERRYDTRIETLHVLGKPPRPALLQQIMGRPIEPFQLSDIIKCADPSTGISALATVFATDESPAPILSNFRTREFSYSPKFRELLEALRSTWKHAAAALCAVTLALTGYYIAGEYQIRTMRSFLTDQIKTVMPDFNGDETDIRGALVRAEAKLTDDLGVLSSPAKVTPLDALIEITQRIPDGPGITIQTIKIVGTRATITGSAPDLSAIERVQKELKTSKSAFAKVNAVPGNPSGSRYGFSVEIILSQ